MHDGFAELLRQPTARRYKLLRSAFLESKFASDPVLALAQLAHSFAEGEFEELPQQVDELMPHAFLSLRLHRIGGMLAIQQNDLARAELHRFAFDAICQAILLTGNGTRNRPWLVTHSSDASELLAARGREVLSQSLVEDENRRYDVLLCDQEQEFWFDLTDLIPLTATRTARRTRPAATVRLKPVRKKAVSRSRR